MEELRTQDDASLVERLLEGDVAALEALMRRHNARVFRSARAVVRDDAAAEDCAQKAWLAAYTNLAQLTDRATFPGWISRIAYHEAIRIARLAKLRAVVGVAADTGETEALPFAEGATPEHDLQRRELRALLEASIDELPDGLREVFVLCEVQELSARETGDILGLSEENVRVRNHRARQALRRTIGDDLRPGEAFSFDGSRCDRIVAAVLSRVRGGRVA